MNILFYCGVIINWIVMGVIGGMIGNPKGMGFVGFLLGLFLGPLGIIVVQISDGDRRECPFCKKRIDKNATVCPYCQREQERQLPLYSEIEKNKTAVSDEDKDINKGLYYLETSEYEKAVHVFRRVLQKLPYNSEVWRFLGDAYDAQGKTDEAIEAYSKADKFGE